MDAANFYFLFKELQNQVLGLFSLFLIFEKGWPKSYTLLKIRIRAATRFNQFVISWILLGIQKYFHSLMLPISESSYPFSQDSFLRPFHRIL